MPQLAALYKKYNEQGFEVVALESQGSDADKIKSLLKDKGATYQATTGGRLTGSTGNGLPQGYLFSAEGKLVGEFRVHALESKVKELLRDVGAAMAGPGPYVKLAPQAAQIKAGVGLGQVLALLRKKKDSTNADEAKEATMMFESLSGAAQGRFDDALAKKDTDPIGAYSKLEKLAAQFTGDEIGTKAKAEVEGMKKDPNFKKELEADTMWKTVTKMEDSLKPVKGEKNYADEAFRKTNIGTITGIVQGCQAITTRFAGTQAAKKAEELMNQFK